MLTDNEVEQSRWVVFDVDGVLIDVSQSYDRAVKLTVEHFLKNKSSPSPRQVSLHLIRQLRKKGLFGDDFQLSEALIAGCLNHPARNFVREFPWGRGVELVRSRYGKFSTKERIEKVFNTYYLGEIYEERLFDYPGLWKEEEAIVDNKLLNTLQKRKRKLGVVTGRDKLEFELAQKIIDFNFDHVVTREILLKPDPHALALIVNNQRGVYVGDTINDQRLVENYRKFYGDFGFLMVERDVQDVNEAISRLLLLSER